MESSIKTKTIYFHVGFHKTGTTSIQKFLSTNKGYLNNLGIHYPVAGRVKSDGKLLDGHHQLAWSLRKKKGFNDENIWFELLEELENSKFEYFIISSEDFIGCNEIHLENLKKYLNNYKVKILFYIREPISYLISAYKEKVKSGLYKESLKFFIEEKITSFNYYNKINLWAIFFMKPNISVFVFDNVKHDSKLLENFCENIGIDFNKCVSVQRKNISPNDSQIKLIRKFNQLTWMLSENTRRNGWPKYFRKTIIQYTKEYGFLIKISSLFGKDMSLSSDKAKLLNKYWIDKEKSNLLEFISREKFSYLERSFL